MDAFRRRACAVLFGQNEHVSPWSRAASLRILPCVQACARVAIFGCEISRCQAQRGGGVHCASCEMVLVDVSVVNCTATFGGGISGPVMAAMTLSGCSILNCKATTTYGGIYCSQGGPMSLKHCVIRGCEAILSGGVGAFAASVAIDSCLVE
eukprot:5361200-Pleurochrysis_carterae.AAC.1